MSALKTRRALKSYSVGLQGSLLPAPQHPAGDLAVLGHLQRLLVEGVVALGEGAPQLPVLRQLPRRETQFVNKGRMEFKTSFCCIVHKKSKYRSVSFFL